MTAPERLLLALAFTGSFSLCTAANYVVSGVVVDSQSQKPLANAHVSLAPTVARGQKLDQITKQDGRFSFAVTQTGKYALQMNKPGYLVQSYKQYWIGGLSSAIVVRDDQDTSHLVFEASRGAAIAGVIKDEDSEPVGRVGIDVFQSLIVDGERNIILRAETAGNAAGAFRLSGLPRGTYYVCAAGRPWFATSVLQIQQIRESFKQIVTQAQQGGQPAQPVPQYSPDPSFRGSAFALTFYPRAQTLDDASPVHLDTGGEAQVSIALPFTRSVTVKGTISLPGEATDGRVTLYMPVHNRYISLEDGPVAKDGTFQLKNVPPGTYEITGGSQSASGASSWYVRQEVAVGTSDMDITLRPRSLGSVFGHVLFEGERPASTASLFVSLRNDEGRLRRVEVDSAGNFSFDRLPADRYEVTAGSADYVAAYFAGPSGERLPLTVDITSGEPVRRDLTLTKAVSVIEGTVEKAEAPQVGAFVLLMPKNPSQRWAYRADQTDSDGSYRLATIPAGDYFLIALSDGTEVAYRDPKVAAILTKAAKPVHLEPGDHLDMKVDVVGTGTLNLPSL